MVGTGYLFFDDGYGYEVGQRGIIPHTFTLIEENQDIDIQKIEDLTIWTTYSCKDNTETKLTEDNLVKTMEKIKEIIIAIKQLDRQINNT